MCEAFESEHLHWDTRIALIKLRSELCAFKETIKCPPFSVLHSCSESGHLVFCCLEDRLLFAVWKGLAFGKWKNKHRGVHDVWLWWKSTGCFVLLAATEVALESVNVVLWFYPSICRTA